jgi:hypothetical protein
VVTFATEEEQTRRAEAAVRHVLAAPRLPDGLADRYLRDGFLDGVRLLEDRLWSHTELPLIRAAVDLWGGDGGCSLAMIVSHLPAEDVRRVIEALEVRCGLRDPSYL